MTTFTYFATIYWLYHPDAQASVQQLQNDLLARLATPPVFSSCRLGVHRKDIVAPSQLPQPSTVIIISPPQTEAIQAMHEFQVALHLNDLQSCWVLTKGHTLASVKQVLQAHPASLATSLTASFFIQRHVLSGKHAEEAGLHIDPLLLATINEPMLNDLAHHPYLQLQDESLLPHDTSIQLNDNEKWILRGIIQNHSLDTIAANLCLSPYTVKSYLGHIMDKLGVHDRTQAVLQALRQNLLN
ncbi:MAG: response regulator transcription factor [Vampirovibrionales bacterium]